eukprot:jgi/Mesen1/4925/ME000246S04152
MQPTAVNCSNQQQPRTAPHNPKLADANCDDAGTGRQLLHPDPSEFKDANEEVERRRKMLGTGWWVVKGNKIYNGLGKRVLFSGVSWSGFETPDGVPHGLWVRSYGSMMDQMARLGFNVIRLPFAGETLLPSTRPTNINYNVNPDLRGLNSFQVMKKLINAFGSRGFRVILDYHRIRLTVANEKGLWYDAKYPESTWIRNWVLLARTFKDSATVVGFDLFNEPHQDASHRGPYWAMGLKLEPVNFRTAVARCANAIQAVNPHALIIVEGMWDNSWWGGNLTQVLAAPLPLKVKGKLMYSTHEYGPYVYDQTYFHTRDFPASLVPRWNKLFGYLYQGNHFPIFVGEFGAKYAIPAQNPIDKIEGIWFRSFVAYIRRWQLPWTYWDWGPNSADTGGILTNDWFTPDYNKLNALKPIMHVKFGPSPGQKL